MDTFLTTLSDWMIVCGAIGFTVATAFSLAMKFFFLPRAYRRAESLIPKSKLTPKEEKLIEWMFY